MPQPTLTPREFAQKWGDNTRKESSSSREHFIDLCQMLGEPTPNEADRSALGSPTRLGCLPQIR